MGHLGSMFLIIQLLPIHYISALPQTFSTCSVSEFRCGNGQCVPFSWRCDHSPDCNDGSDESNCEKNECLYNNGGCSHHCVDQPMGFICDCPSDMRLVGDTQCEEIDKCLYSDVCNQLCTHINGTFYCNCHEGYHMSPKTGECKAKGDVAQVVFSNSEGLHWVSTNGKVKRKVDAKLQGPGPLGALTANNTLYWARPGQGSIYSISLEREPYQPVLAIEGHGAVLGLAIDWIHQLLYWTNAKTHSVNVARLDGSAQRLLIGGVDQPTGVALDPSLGLLFWGDGGSSKIERASLDGQNRIALVTSAIQYPAAISLDLTRKLLYWADSGKRSISRVDFEGQHRKTVVESNGYLDKPIGLSVFESRLYWTEETSQSICSADKHNGSDFRVLLHSISSPGGLALIHPVLQLNGPDLCLTSEMKCKYRCVPDFFSPIRPPRFECMHPVGSVRDQETVVSHPVPTTTLSDTAFAGILSLICRFVYHTVCLSVVVVGMMFLWWRAEFMPIRSVHIQDHLLKESEDHLILGPGRGFQITTDKDKWLNMDLDLD